ncbi:unnamed protein product [Allacma fusca]|uniref:Uncharacterized protein n=1 Tax=Allacma fusca TaxID=39272 RepID=A0A8J2P6S1_9HEXA|nr:unnamed protein product [Allacma fusca]
MVLGEIWSKGSPGFKRKAQSLYIKKASYKIFEKMNLVETILKGLLMLTFISISNGQNQTKFPESLSPGVFIRKLNSTRVYESFAAIVYEFELPTYPNNNTLVFDYECSSPKYATNYSCPIFYHLHKIRDELRSTIELQHLRHPESSSDMAFEISSCEKILPHFRSTTITAEKLKKYQQLLRACANGLFLKHPLITRFNQKEPRQSYTDLIKGYIENYYQFLPSEKRQDKSILLNLLTTANALGLTQMLEEAQMWTEVMNDCKTSTVPAHLLNSEKLSWSLNYLRPRLAAKNLTLVLPLDDISSYYKASIADCVMTKTQLLIRILIPVKSVSSDWNLYSVTPVPFVYNDGEDGSQLICTLKNIDHDQINSFETNSKLAYPITACDTKRDIVCHTGEDDLTMHQFKKTCVAEIFGESPSQVRKTCDLHCEPIDSFRSPILFRVAADKFYLAGKPNESIQVRCPNSTKSLSPPKEGSLEIQLPCQCSLTHQNKRFVIQEPCGQNMTILNMKPLHLAPIVSETESEIEPTTPAGTDLNEAEKLKKYQQLLRACANGLFLKHPLITRFNQKEPRQSYTDLIKGYIENYYQFLPSEKRQDKSILLNLLTTANALGLTQMLEEAQMWTEVMNDCKTSTVPAHLLNSEKLSWSLNYLRPRLAAKNLTLVLPLDDISSYYKASIADCVMTKTQLLIRILIPVKSVSSDWNLYSVTPVPFVYNDGEDGSQLICTLKNIDHDQIYSFETKSKLAYPITACDTKRDIVCHTGEDDLTMHQFKKTCVAEIFGESPSQVRKTCDLHCEPIDSFRSPILFRVAADKFYLAGKPNESIQVRCPNSTKSLSPPKEGSLEIQLPCQCSLTHQNKRFVIQEPCGQNMTILNMKPLHLAPIVSETESEIEPTTPAGTDLNEGSFETFVLPKNRFKQYDW